MAKAAMKSGILLFEKGKETVAELSETVEDLWAEANAEVEEETIGEVVEDVPEDLKTVSD
jgi:hypothetical protein